MIQEVLGRLEGVKKSGDGWTARCPSHDDRSSSLSIKENKSGAPWPAFRCFTGCTFEQIRAALEAKGVIAPRKDTRRFDDDSNRVTQRIAYPVRDAKGNLIATKIRLEWSQKSKTFTWDYIGNVKPAGFNSSDLLYGAERAGRVDPDVAAILTEGEKACDALTNLGARCAVSAVCGASASLTAVALECLRGREVYLWPDNDDIGRAFMAKAAVTLRGIASKVWLLADPLADPKDDAADFVRRGATADSLDELIEAARPYPYGLPLGAVEMADPKLVEETRKDTDAWRTGDRRGLVTTGLRTLDSKIRGGFRAGDVYLVGAPSGGGKTTLMQSFAAAGEKETKVLFASPEMSSVSLLRREAVRRSGQPEGSEAFFLELLSKIPARPPRVVLFTKVDATMREISDAARAIPELGLILIDYLQLVADFEGRTPRYLLIAQVVQEALRLATDLQVPVVVSSQVNVTIGPGGAKVYTFRESAMPEHKAASVLIFERGREYDPRSPVRGRQVWIRLLCLKNRHGEQFAPIDLTWTPGLFQIEEGRPFDEDAADPERRDPTPPEPEAQRSIPDFSPQAE